MSDFVTKADIMNDKTYHWQIAQDGDFHAIYALLYNSPLRQSWGIDDVRRRMIIPLYLGQLVIFYDQDKNLCGFLTLGFLNDIAEEHQGTIGIQSYDWRSGKQLWVVDFVATDGGGMKMLRTITRDLDTKQYGEVKYFRLKHKQLRSVRP